MSIYDIDFSKAGPQLDVPDKRFRNTVAWIGILLSPLQWVRDLWFGSYRTGGTAIAYTPGTYPKYARVLYRQKVYESLMNGNTAAPTDQTKWFVVQQNFIGAFERVAYNGNALTFIYAINKYFGTVFRQPPNQSDIYVTVFQKPTSVFVIGGTEANSSVVYANRSSEFIVDSYSFAGYNNMTIFVPAATYTAIDPVAANAEKIVRAFANLYINAGITYTISPY